MPTITLVQQSKNAKIPTRWLKLTEHLLISQDNMNDGQNKEVIVHDWPLVDALKFRSRTLLGKFLKEKLAEKIQQVYRLSPEEITDEQFRDGTEIFIADTKHKLKSEESY